MKENEKINGWTFEETVKTAENLMEAESNMFKWDVLRHLRDFAENYKDELEQYKAIGTVEEIQRKIDALKYDCTRYEEQLSIARGEKQVSTEDDMLLEEYRAIGTVEDFKNAVEIIRPRKPYEGSFGTILCSLCGEKVGQMVTKTIKEGCMNFCANCGSMIDWSE